MNRIEQTFAALKANNEPALMPFLTIGDPDVDTTIEIIHELERAGAHIIELGVPYSDPLADGPVIQRASERALHNKLNIIDCIRVAKRAREQGSELTFVLFTYYNPALQLGLERFFELMSEHEISGVIIPDLPMEEDEEVLAIATRYGIHLIPLVAPTSRDRIARITGRASGFIYCVSSIGVTGVRTSFAEGIEEFLKDVRASTTLPLAVGFGISSREHVQYFASMADGVVVGSAIVRKVEEVLTELQNPEKKQAALLQIREFVASLKY